MRSWQFILIFIISVKLYSCGNFVTQQQSRLSISGGEVIDSQEFPSVIMLYNEMTHTVCTGTFVTHDTVLTAAHCIGENSDEYKEVQHSIRLWESTVVNGVPSFQGTKASVSVHIHPQWISESKRKVVNQFDLGIVLFPPNTATEVASLAHQSPRSQEKVTIVGYGLPGYLADGSEASVKVGTKRKGVNRIAGLFQGLIYIKDFSQKGPDEGISELNGWARTAPGDSGGPMFIDQKLVGITAGGGQISAKKGFSAYVNLHSVSSGNFLRSHQVNLQLESEF